MARADDFQRIEDAENHYRDRVTPLVPLWEFARNLRADELLPQDDEGRAIYPDDE